MEQKDGVPVLLLLERPHAAAKYRALGEASLDGDSLDSLGEADGGLVADPLHRRGEEPRETSSSSSGIIPSSQQYVATNTAAQARKRDYSSKTRQLKRQ